MATSFFEDLSKSFLYKVLGLLASFGVQVIITRYLGIDNYGIWNKALSWMQILLIFSLMGNQKKLLKDASSSVSQAFNQYIKTTIQVVITFILCYGIYFFWGLTIGYIDDSNFKIVTWLVMMYGVFVVINKLNTSMLQAIQKNYLTIIINLLFIPVINVLLIVALLYSFGNNVYVLISFPIASLGAALIFFYFINSHFDRPNRSLEFSSNWNIHFWLNDIAKTLLPYANIVILSFFLVDSDIGGYSAAYKFGTLLMVFTSIFMSFSPVIVKLLGKNEKDKLEQSYLNISKVLLVIVFPLLLSFFIFGDFIMKVFGDEFIEYAIVLKILSIGIYFNAITGPIGEILNMSGNEKIEKNINLTAAFSNIILVYILTITFGIYGAAVAFMLPQVFANLSKLFWVKKKLKIRTVGKDHFKIIVLQLSLSILVFIKSSVFISILIYILILISYYSIIGFSQWVKLRDVKQIMNI